MQALFDCVPANENVLDLELDTLQRMLMALGGESAAPQVAEAIRRIEAEQARRNGG
jgi:hypothetical protein